MTKPTTPGIAELLIDLILAAKRGSSYGSERAAVLAHVAGLERERDEARAAAEKEFANVMALSAERDAYRADAERYRWLRDQTADDNLCIVGKDSVFPRFVNYSKAIDDYIDAAIAQRGGKDA